MNHAAPIKPLLLTLLCVMLLVTQLDGAHWHFCFDGKEAPVSIHLIDMESHHGDKPGMQASHDDTDVSMGVVVAPKASTHDFNLDAAPVLLVAAFVLALLFAKPQFQSPKSIRVAASVPYAFLPPLRGPPR